MNKFLKRFVAFQLSLFALCVFGAFTTTASTDTRTETVLPRMGMMRAPTDVTVVNLTPIRYAKDVAGSNQQGYWLSYGERCFMRRSAAFVAVGVDGQRVLVLSRQTDPGYLPTEGSAYCTQETLFWIGYQQFLLSAEAYRNAEREKLVQETAEQRDKRVIRQLLDGQLARE